MADFFTRAWTDLVGRLEGPMNLRLIIQPLMACILAILHVIVPYLLVRAPVTRLVGKKKEKL